APNPMSELYATRSPDSGRSPPVPSSAAARYPPGPGVVARAGTADQSRGSGRRRASMNAAVSPTVRVMGPAWARVPKGLDGNIGMTPYVGLRATIPQNAAGIRTEPPPSVPRASWPRPAATAAEPPPLEPPGVSAGSEGSLPADRSGVPQRAPPAGARGALAQPRAAGRRPPATGAAGGERRVVGVARDAGDRVVGDPLPRELGRGGLADHHAPRLVHRRGDGGVVGPGTRLGGIGLVREQPGAPQRGNSTGVEDVLDGRRHAVQRPVRDPPAVPVLGLARGGHGRGAVDVTEGVDLAVDPIDRVQRLAGGIDRGHPAATEAVGELQGGEGESHR